MKLRRPCIESGCTRLTTKTRCAEHEAAFQRQRNRRRTHYHGNWRTISQQARQTQPWCTNCGATTDLTVDHIHPASLEHGVQVLCRPCNARKGNRGGDGQKFDHTP